MTEQTPIPEVGDFVVAYQYGSWDCVGPLTRVTPQRVWFKRWHSEGYFDREAVRFFGPQKQAIDLVSVLKGIEANHSRQQVALAAQRLAQVDRAFHNALLALEPNND